MTIEIKDKGIIEADDSISLDLRCFRNEEISEILFAYEVAKRAHEWEVRKTTWDAYITHPVAVANILLHQLWPELWVTIAKEEVITALLHDVPENSTFDISSIRLLFWNIVWNLVNLMTKKNLILFLDQEQRGIYDNLNEIEQSDYILSIKPQLKPLQLSDYYGWIATDQRAIRIKWADKRHNHSTLHLMGEGKMQEEIEETRVYFEGLMT